MEDLNEKTGNLVARAKEGDSKALEALYRLYQQRLNAAVKQNIGRKLKSRVETQDLVQSVWKDVLSDMNGFEYRGHNSFFQWLSTRILRKIQDKGRYFTSKKRDMQKEQPILRESALTKEDEMRAAKDPTPSQAVLVDEKLKKLMGLLDHLPDPQRQTLVLRLRDELSFDEIARILGKSSGAVRQLYSRALKKIDELTGNGRIG